MKKLMEINTDNLRMVNGQIKPINGMTEKLVSIFNSLNRENFIPEEFNIFLLEGDEDAKITRLILSSCCFLLFIFFLFF